MNKLTTHVVIVCLVTVLQSEGRHHRIRKRVVFGHEAEPHSRPYQVHNILTLENGDVQLCGGALISDRYVLTAAHCFVNLQNLTHTIVIMGAHRLTDQDKEYQISTSYIIHDGFRQFPEGHTENDIALIKLDEPVKLSSKIQLISLPKRSQANESLNNVLAKEAGWGKTENEENSDILNEGTVKITEEESVCVPSKPLICAWANDGHAACAGDSGSPLVSGDIVIGIISSGFCIAYSYYTRVASFLDWIESNADITIVD